MLVPLILIGCFARVAGMLGPQEWGNSVLTELNAPFFA